MTDQTTPAAGTDDQPPTDTELPGMWETADFTGGPDETRPPAPPTDDWAIVARHTVIDGLVLDWYRTTAAYEYEAGSSRWALSAARSGVLVGHGVYLHTIPADQLALADRAYRILATRRDTDRDLAQAIATHEDDRTGRPPFGRGKLARIQQEA